MSRAGRLASLLALLGGCAQVLDIPDDPVLVASGPWGCLEQPLPRPVPAAATALVQVRACDFVSNCQTAVTGLRGRLCAKRDVDCTNPLSIDIVDDGGLLSFTVPTPPDGFDGYLEINSATELCTNPSLGEQGPILCGLSPACNPAAPDEACEVPLYARSLLFFNPPIFNDTVTPLVVPLLASASIPMLIQAAHATTLDPTTGNLFITALDCDGTPASGVSYRIDRDHDRVTQLYVAESVPRDTALETDSSGVGGFLGVPPGFVNVVGTNPGLRDFGEISLLAAPFTMTYSFLAPPSASSP